MLNLSISKNKNRSYNLYNNETKKEYKNIRIAELKKILKIYYQDTQINNCKNYRELKYWIKNRNKLDEPIFCEFIDEEETLIV